MVIERVVPISTSPIRRAGMVRSALTAYIGLVAERPNVFRFLFSSHFSDSSSTMALLDGGRPLSTPPPPVASVIVGDVVEMVRISSSSVDAVLVR